MIIFLYGQNSYGLIQYVNQLVERYQKKYPDSFNLHRFDLEEDNPAEVENTIKGTSFFKQVKFIVAKNPLAKSAFIEKVIKEKGLAKDKDTVLLLYQAGSEKDLKEKHDKLFNLLKKEGQIKEFRPPTAQAANKFATSHLAKHKISIKKDFLTKLIKETSSDLWRLRNELDKLISFAVEKKKKDISEDDVTKLISFKIDRNIFGIIDAAFSNQARALVLFDDYLTQGGDPLYLLSMIAFQLRNMLVIRESIDKKIQYAQILKKTGMHPYLFKKNYETAQKYTSDELKKNFQKVVNFEIALKTGQAEAENIFFKVFL